METRTRRRTARSVAIGAVTAAIVTLDWSTKAFAAVTLDDRIIEVGSVLTLRLGHNPGIAFGLGSRLPGSAVIAATLVVTIVVALAATRGVFDPPIAAGLVVGGAVSNLGDRVVGGTVVDFLDLGWWPAFNVADIAICAGAALMVLASFRAPQIADD